MKVEKIINIDFTDEEREAIKTLKSVDCSGIRCTECPFNLKDRVGCLISYVKDMASERRII